ncbi:MAG: sugar ABC transporter substrate-binding protein [Lachnospiraceae bacterium]|nr:sugar ABC transporter substrate-binding protein [Lachnospiraceae bacterium]
MKNIKKIVTLFLSITLLVSIMTGCASSQRSEPEEIKEETGEKSADLPEESEEPRESLFRIGYPAITTPSAMLCARDANAAYICEALGGEAVFALQESWATEDIINCVEQLIELDVDAIVICPISEAPMARIAQLCDDAGVYYIWNHRQIYDQEIMDLCTSSEYFLGWAVEDEYSAAYNCMQYMSEQGITDICLITEDLSDTVAALREQGTRAGAEDFGITIHSEFRGPKSANEITEAVESFLSAYPETQLIFVTGATIDAHVDAITSATEQAGRNDVKMAALDLLENADDATKEGRFLVQAGGQHVPNYVYCTVVAAHALLDGQRLGQNYIDLNMALSLAYDYDDLTGYYDYVIGDLPLYTADELVNIFFKDGFTAEDLKKLAENYSNNERAEAHKDMEQGSIAEYQNEYFH